MIILLNIAACFSKQMQHLHQIHFGKRGSKSLFGGLLLCATASTRSNSQVIYSCIRPLVWSRDRRWPALGCIRRIALISTEQLLAHRRSINHISAFLFLPKIALVGCLPIAFCMLNDFVCLRSISLFTLLALAMDGQTTFPYLVFLSFRIQRQLTVDRLAPTTFHFTYEWF